MRSPTKQEVETAVAYGKLRDYIKERATLRVKTMHIPKEREPTFAMIAVMQTAWDMAKESEEREVMFHHSLASLIGFNDMMAGMWAHALKMGTEADFMNALHMATGAFTARVTPKTGDATDGTRIADTGTTEARDGDDDADQGKAGA